MKKSFVLILLAGLLFLFAGCSNKKADSPSTVPTTQTVPTTVDSVKLYEETYLPAVQALEGLDSVAMEITVTKQVQAGTEVFTEDTALILTYYGLNSDRPSASIHKTVTIGEQENSFYEIISGDNMYLTVNGMDLMGPAEPLQIIPAQLIDSSLYETVNAEPGTDGTRFTFQAPTGPEGWVLPENATFITGDANAHISSDGSLAGSQYNATYKYGPASVTVSISAKITSTQPAPLAIPSTTVYRQLSSPGALQYLENASAYLQAAENFDTRYIRRIDCEASGMYHTMEQIVSSAGLGTEHRSTRVLNHSIYDSSRGGMISSYTHTETFEDGRYTLVSTEEGSDSSTEVAAEELVTFYKNNMVFTIPLLDYIADITVTEYSDVLLIRLQPSASLAELICQNSCKELYQDPGFLDNLSESCDYTQISSYLSISKYTGLPIASGIHYAGSHSIQGYPYRLQADHNQQYLLGASYEETSQSGAKPPVYEVTDSHGNTLYLYATTAITDGKISEKAKELSTVAIAMEPGILQALAACTNPVTITPELHDRARERLAAFGGFDPEMENKPVSLWIASLLTLKLKQGYLNCESLSLSASGDIPVLEVPSIVLDEASTQSLAEVLSQVLEADYWQTSCQGAAIYDAWYTGNSDTLKQLFKDSTAFDIPVTQRSQEIFTRAEGYLRSGQTLLYAVDVLDLYAENGLLALLENAGYTIDPK